MFSALGNRNQRNHLMRQRSNLVSNIIMVMLVVFPYVKFLWLQMRNVQGEYASGNLLYLIAPDVMYLVVLAAAAYAAINETTLNQVAIVKLLHVPYYLIRLALYIGPYGLPVFVHELLFDSITIFITGVYMLGLERVKTIYKVFGFIYIIDIVAVIQLLYIRRREADEV